MLLRVDVEERGGSAVVTATGEIDASTAERLETAISGAFEDGYRRVLVDFAGVSFIDSTGLSVLVKAHRTATSREAHFGIVRPTPQTRKLIGVLGLDGVLHLHDTLDEGLGRSS